MFNDPPANEENEEDEFLGFTGVNICEVDNNLQLIMDNAQDLS